MFEREETENVYVGENEGESVYVCVRERRGERRRRGERERERERERASFRES